MPKEWWVFRQEKFLVNSNEVWIIFFENLILVQDERWRRALSMQVKGVRLARGEITGGRVSNAQESTLKWDIARRKAR